MENDNGFRQRLEEAKNNSDKIKIIFQYPNSPRLTVRRGDIISVKKDCFTIQDIYDGELTFSYDFIVEISIDKHNL
jgi:hypothetical protein